MIFHGNSIRWFETSLCAHLRQENYWIDLVRVKCFILNDYNGDGMFSVFFLLYIIGRPGHILLFILCQRVRLDRLHLSPRQQVMAFHLEQCHFYYGHCFYWSVEPSSWILVLNYHSQPIARPYTVYTRLPRCLFEFGTYPPNFVDGPGQLR